MRVMLKGIATATKRLADGTAVKYFYAWRGGPRLEGEPGTPDFVASYNAAIARRKTRPKGTLGHLISVFKGSTEFGKLSERTQSDYLQQIENSKQSFRACLSWP